MFYLKCELTGPVNKFRIMQFQPNGPDKAIEQLSDEYKAVEKLIFYERKYGNKYDFSKEDKYNEIEISAQEYLELIKQKSEIIKQDFKKMTIIELKELCKALGITPANGKEKTMEKIIKYYLEV